MTSICSACTSLSLSLFLSTWHNSRNYSLTVARSCVLRVYIPTREASRFIFCAESMYRYTQRKRERERERERPAWPRTSKPVEINTATSQRRKINWFSFYHREISSDRATSVLRITIARSECALKRSCKCFRDSDSIAGGHRTTEYICTEITDERAWIILKFDIVTIFSFCVCFTASFERFGNKLRLITKFHVLSSDSMFEQTLTNCPIEIDEIALSLSCQLFVFVWKMIDFICVSGSYLLQISF